MTINQLIGKDTSIAFRQIKAVFEVTAVSEEISTYLSPGTRYTTPSQIFEAFHFLMHETKEYFITLHLNGKNQISCCDVVSIGSLNQSIVHPREVFKTALLSSAAAIILVHQHPTGDPSPSSEDIAITRRLKEAGDIIGIKILDHCIIGQDSYISFVERGLL